MKSILIIFFLFLCYNVVAQYPSQQNPTQFSTGWFKQGWPQADSGHILAVRPPNFTPRFPGTTILYQNNGVDTSIHYWTGGRWIKILPNGIDTTSLSNRINLKLNISDTANMLLPYLRKADTTNKWVQDIYVRNDSLFKFKNGLETFVDTLNGGGGGSGTVTSVGLSMPSAFSVTPSTITTSGTFNVSGAGTAAQYIRGTGTLATTDTGMIPNFYLKVRGLLSGTSPITFNQTTGIIGINNANASGTKGAASFTGAFSDNGSGLIDLADLVSAGSCTNCSITYDAKGRATAYSNGTAAGITSLNGLTASVQVFAFGSSGITPNFSSSVGTHTLNIPLANGAGVTSGTITKTEYDIFNNKLSGLQNIGTGFRWYAGLTGSTANEKTVYSSNTIIWDSTSNSSGLTAKADTSVLATQYDLTQVVTSPALPLNSIQFNNAGAFGGDSLQYYPTDNKLLTSQDYIQYGRPVTGFFQDSGFNFTTGRLWTIYPRHSNGTPGQAVDPSWGADTLQPFYSEISNTLYDINQPENAVLNIVKFGNYGSYRPMFRIGLEQDFYHSIEYHAAVVKPRMMNPNAEVRLWSWTIDDSSGAAHLDTRASSISYLLSDVTNIDYNRPYFGVGPGGLLAQTFGAPFGEIAILHGASPGHRMGMFIDTSSGGVGFSSLYVSTNTAALTIGANGGATAIDIFNPATSGGYIAAYKHVQVNGKPLGISNLPINSIGMYVTSPTVGYIHAVNTDGSGFADINTVGKYSINRDSNIVITTKLFSIYNHYTPTDSIFHIRGTGDVYAKGMITARADSTTSATGGFLYRDATTGNFRITANPGGTTLYTGDGTLGGNRNVNANNLNLTFSDVNTFLINQDVFALAKADGTFPYSTTIVAPSQKIQSGYTPTVGTFSKGAAITIDTNNNVSLGTGFITSSHPLYTYGSAFAQGFTSARGNFYRVDNISTDQTVGLESYWFNIDASSGNVTVTLPAASTSFGSNVGIRYIFRRVDNSGNTVTIQRNGTPGTDTINGGSSFTLTSQYETKGIQCVSTSTFAILTL